MGNQDPATKKYNEFIAAVTGLRTFRLRYNGGNPSLEETKAARKLVPIMTGKLFNICYEI